MNAIIAISKIGAAEITEFAASDAETGLNGFCTLPNGEEAFFFVTGTETKAGVTCKVRIPGAEAFSIGKIMRRTYAEMLVLGSFKTPQK